MPAFSAWITAATVLASARRLTRTVTPSISSSMIPETPSALRVRLRPRQPLEASSGKDARPFVPAVVDPLMTGLH